MRFRVIALPCVGIGVVAAFVISIGALAAGAGEPAAAPAAPVPLPSHLPHQCGMTVLTEEACRLLDETLEYRYTCNTDPQFAANIFHRTALYTTWEWQATTDHSCPSLSGDAPLTVGESWAWMTGEPAATVPCYGLGSCETKTAVQHWTIYAPVAFYVADVQGFTVSSSFPYGPHFGQRTFVYP